MLLSNFIQIEIWFTEVGRDLGEKYLEPAGRFRPKAEVQSESLTAASRKLWFFDLLDFKPDSDASTTPFSDSDLEALDI